MTPVDQFVHSVQQSFAANRATDWSRVGLAVVPAVAVSVGLAIWLRRHRQRQELSTRIQSLLSTAGLSQLDFADLTRIAAVGGVPVLEIMTGLAAFEQATAKLLAGEAPTLQPVGSSLFERVRHLRKALGFSPLPAHLWLLSTRELVVGDSDAAGGDSGHVVDVNEASFAVDWPAAALLVEGALCSMTIDRPDDARYLTRVRVLKVETPPTATTTATAESHGESPGRRTFFAHDEEPVRQQDRRHMRLRVNASVTVQVIELTGATDDPPTVEPPPPGTAATIAGTIVDVSAGGLSMNLPVSPGGLVARGERVRCWFTLDPHATFQALVAVVMGAGIVSGTQHLRLAFVSLAQAERDRLAAAVARHQGAPPPSADAGR
jgi:hypothetical protein